MNKVGRLSIWPRGLVQAFVLLLTATLAVLVIVGARERASSVDVVDPLAVQPILEQLQPGTTFHTVDLTYRRHGEADVPETEGPEEKRTETWMTFDAVGVLSEYRSETRTLSGVLVQSSVSEEGALVFVDSDGRELKRLEGTLSDSEIEGLKRVISSAITATFQSVKSQETKAGTILGEAVVVLESQHPLHRGPAVPPIVENENLTRSSRGFRIPYVADLPDGTVEVRRSYVLPDEYRTLRTEVVAVDRDGNETLLESTEHTVFEVITK